MSQTLTPSTVDADPAVSHATSAISVTTVAEQAFARLLAIAERGNSGQTVRVARFIASTYNGDVFPFDPFELRAVDLAIGDDMLRCLDALRWARADLHTLVPDGDRRVRAVIDSWGLQWPADA